MHSSVQLAAAERWEFTSRHRWQKTWSQGLVMTGYSTSSWQMGHTNSAVCPSSERTLFKCASVALGWGWGKGAVSPLSASTDTLGMRNTASRGILAAKQQMSLTSEVLAAMLKSE